MNASSGLKKNLYLNFIEFLFKFLDMQYQIDRLQSIVLRLASNIDTLNHQSDTQDSSPVYFESNVKHEQIDDVRKLSRCHTYTH
jgi:hypothetical protein